MSSKILAIADDATARRIYKTAPPELVEILENSYGKDFFSENIMDRIKSFEDACEYNNTNPKASRFMVGTRNQRYQERVAEITKALNEGWVPNYSNSNEYKYTPYFYLDNPSGFRFRATLCSHTVAHSGSGSRFAFKSDKLATYAGKQFLKEYENWMTPESISEGCISNMAPLRKKNTGDIKAWEAYIIPKINSFADACAEVSENPYDPKFNEGTSDEIAYKKYKVVCRALNGGWVPDWANASQAKWYPWMEYNSAAAGFRFYDSFYSITRALTGSGSRVRLCSDNIAKHAGTKFEGLISDTLM